MQKAEEDGRVAKEMKTDRVSKSILEPAKLVKDPMQNLEKQQQMFQESVQRNIEALQQQQKAQFAMMQKTMEQFMNMNVRPTTTENKPPKQDDKVKVNSKGAIPKQVTNISESDSDTDISDIIKYRSKRKTSLDVDVRGMKQSLYELPEFDGEPMKWPKFIAAYRNSVEYAKFNNVENMMRLLKYVKGDALRTIQARLIHPDGVPKAIQTLEKTFGDPVLVVDSLLKAIMNAESPKEFKPSSIVNYSIKVTDLVCYIKAMNDKNQLSSEFLVRDITRRLPIPLQMKWEEAKCEIVNAKATLENLEEWLETVADRYKNVAINSGGLHLGTSYKETAFDSRREKPRFQTTHFHDTTVETPPLEERRSQYKKSIKKDCPYCKKEHHNLKECLTFNQLSYQQKGQFLRRKRMCYTCYERHQDFTSCPERRKREDVDKAEGGPQREGSFVNHHANADGCKVIFRVIPITVHGPKKSINTFAILDDASSVTLIEDSVANELRLKITQEDQPLELAWTRSTTTKFNSNKVVCYVSSEGSEGKKYKVKNVCTVPGLNLPQQSLSVAELKKRYPYLKDVVMEELERVKPTMLIGLEHAHLGAPALIRVGKFNEPIASKTKLGWTIHGPDSHSTDEKMYTFFACRCEANDDELHELVRQQFSTEAFGIKPLGKNVESVENEKARDLLIRKTLKVDNRFKAPLLWKHENLELPNSYVMAKWRLRGLNLKLDKNPELKKAYSLKIEEYLQKGYARKVSSQELKVQPKNQWFLPHFPVFNVNKPGKMRFVFDAAAKVGNQSLNSFLVRGPDFYTSLIEILFNFRLYKIAVVGDIAEMFHQIIIREEDQPAQRFLWNNEVYQMIRMTFGATCSPSTAQFVKNFNAEQNRDQFPEAYDTIVNRTYVDDSLDSYKTEKEAIEVTKQVIEVHKRGGFHIRNFISNSKSVQLNLLGEETNCDIVDLNREEEIVTEKVLGMYWKVTTDSIVFKVNYLEKLKIVPEKSPTKREFLRILMSVFDPHGYIGNYTVLGKIILQDIWRSKIGWDEKLKEKEQSKFIRWIKELENIKVFQLPRCISNNIPFTDHIELHTFSDASEQAFGAVCYIRTKRDNVIDIRLMGSKTRVAPTKMLSIPRLELQGFLLGMRWARTMIQSLNRIKFQSVYHWTDSNNVLSWVESEERKYSIFVAHRVSEVQEYLEQQKNVEIRYVPTKMNPADETTKWAKPVDVSPTSSWVEGPYFLKQEKINWPIRKFQQRSTEELKQIYLHGCYLERYQLIQFVNYSTLKPLVKTIAWIMRFSHNMKRKCRGEKVILKKWLSEEEMKEANLYLLMQAQWESFKDEIAYLEAGNEVPRTSNILKLCPMLDQRGLIRIDGRLKPDENISYETANPIILDKNHHFTKLLVVEYHQYYAHQNHETVINEIRRKYYIPKMRTLVKKVTQKCQQCMNNKVFPRPPQMGKLPIARTDVKATPFSQTGVDLLGPFVVTIGRKAHKYWVVLFTCLTIRAIHLELVQSLSTDDFILAYRNFCNIRIRPRNMYCDNGTNFVGASRELKQSWEQMKTKNQNVKNNTIVTDYETEWHFNPPLSPHMGGAWERMVRSVKNTLKVLMNEQKPRVETFRSLLFEVMNIINSRPLTYKPTDPGIAPAITPNDILKLEIGGVCLIGEFEDSDLSRRKQWRIAQRMADHFWKRWVTEYMPELTKRSKWHVKQQPIKVGDIAVIVDANQSRNTWEKGTVTKIFKDCTNQVRSAEVRVPEINPATKAIKYKYFKRPAVKLAILEI